MRAAALMLLAACACGQRTGELARRWKTHAAEGKKYIQEEQALVAYFDAQYRAIAYQVWADDQLEAVRLHRASSLDDYNRVGNKAQEVFFHRYAFYPPHFFPPLNDDFPFTANFTEAQVPVMWSKVLRENGLTSATQIEPYLAKRRAEDAQLAIHEGRAQAIAARLRMEIWYAREYVDALDGIETFRGVIARGGASLRTNSEPLPTQWLERASNLGWMKGTKQGSEIEWQLTGAGRAWITAGSADDAARTLYQRASILTVP
jgi:hypothetical protein